MERYLSYFSDCSLQFLYLPNNQIDYLPSIITRLPLIYLDLLGNNLQTLPNNIGDFKLLEELNVSSNSIDILPDSICTLPKLKFLYLSQNKLKMLPMELGLISKQHSL